MTLLSSELKKVGPLKKDENFFVFVRQYGMVGLAISCIVRVELIALREVVIKLKSCFS